MTRDVYYLVAIGALIGLSFYLYDHLREAHESIRHKDSIITEQTSEIEYRRTEKGKIIAQKDAAILTASEVSKAYPAVVEQLKKEFDIKLKDLKAYVKNEFEVQGQGEASVTNNYFTDSTGRKIRYRDLSFNDGYLNFKSVIYDSLTTALSTYVYRDTISTAVSSKKKWIFGSEKLYAQSMLQNPNAKVTGTTNLLIAAHRDKRWVVTGGVYFDPFRQNYGVSVGLGYALIKF